MKKKAFTLVELIVVITILAILGTISFISLQSYTREARDSKRLSDVNNIFKKITLERIKGVYPSNIMSNGESTSGGLIIMGSNPTDSKQGTVNFKEIKESETSFKDPNGNDYVLGYAVGGNGTGAYKFVQVATLSESKNEAVLVGDYYKSLSGDSESIIFVDPNDTGLGIVEDKKSLLPYSLTYVPPPPRFTISNCPSINTAQNGTNSTKANILANINNYIGCDIGGMIGKIAGYTYSGSINDANKMILLVIGTDNVNIAFGTFFYNIPSLPDITGETQTNNMHLNIVSWDGLSNTQKIVDSLTNATLETGKAAQICNGKTDGGQAWYLPASEELNQLYCYSNIASTGHGRYGDVSYGSNCVNKGYISSRINTLGGFSSAIYSASNEGSHSMAWRHHFTDGYRMSNDKTYLLNVRCVSRF